MAPVLWIGHPLVPKGLCLNPAGEYLACAFCRSRAGNPVEFAADAGLQNHYLRQSGASRNWHHASQAAYDQRAQPGASKHHRGRERRRPKPEALKLECRTSARGLPSRNHPASAPSPSSAAPKRLTRCVIHYATGDSEEEGATLKLTRGETGFQKFRAVTGLIEPSRVLAPAGRGPADRGHPRQHQREAEDDNRWYWHEDRRAAPKRPWQPWQPDRWH